MGSHQATIAPVSGWIAMGSEKLTVLGVNSMMYSKDISLPMESDRNRHLMEKKASPSQI
jgi:hypothetical protein